MRSNEPDAALPLAAELSLSVVAVTPLSQQSIHAIKSDTMRLYLWGSIQYRILDSSMHTTGISFLYKPELDGFQRCAGINEARLGQQGGQSTEQIFLYSNGPEIYQAGFVFGRLNAASLSTGDVRSFLLVIVYLTLRRDRIAHHGNSALEQRRRLGYHRTRTLESQTDR